MKRTIKTLVCLFIVGLVIFGCSSKGTNSEQSYVTSTAKSILADSPTPTTPPLIPTIQHTLTLTDSPLLINTPSAYPTTVLELELGEQVPVCIEGKTLPQNVGALDLPGTMILYDKDSRELYTLDGITFERNILETLDTQDIIIFGLSPDRQWLAFSPVEQDGKGVFESPRIILVRSDGEKIEKKIDLSWVKSHKKPEDQLIGFATGRWLNDKLIYAYINSKTDPNDHYHGDYYPVIIDPFAGVVVETEMFDRFFQLDGNDAIQFSPDLEHVIHYEHGITLSEINDTIKIRKWNDKQSGFIGFGIVEWSPDSAWAVFTSQRSGDSIITLINKNGNEIKEIKNLITDSIVNSFYWSPNSNFLAFPSSNNVDGDIVYLFDNMDNRFILKCPLLRVDLPMPDFIWSPDGKWVAITQDGIPMRLLKVASGNIYNFQAEDMMIGWSDKQSWGEGK